LARIKNNATKTKTKKERKQETDSKPKLPGRRNKNERMRREEVATP
jgi:hypothetical protein